ncbi:MAG: hypothetical protein ACKO1V_06520 [Cyanobium sp.]
MKTLLVLVAVTFGLLSSKDLKSLFINLSDNSSITVSTINCGSKNECDIELVKKDSKGKVLWKRIIGGTSYDKAGQVIRTKDGSYIVVGSTSSFGKGNYDVLVAKVSSNGEILWQKTYGEFLNDYGSRIAEVENNLYQIEGTKQVCKTVNVSNDCYDREWLFRIDESGLVK